jgi:hypothetical protein
MTDTVATAKVQAQEKKTKNQVLNLDEIPNGRRRPVETCQFIDKMKSWREESARSTLLIR